MYINIYYMSILYVNNDLPVQYSRGIENLAETSTYEVFNSNLKNR